MGGLGDTDNFLSQNPLLAKACHLGRFEPASFFSPASWPTWQVNCSSAMGTAPLAWGPLADQ